MKRWIVFLLLAAAPLVAQEQPAKNVILFLGDAQLEGAVATDKVGGDPDDPAIWIHSSDPNMSLILGTDKAAAPARRSQRCWSQC